MRLKLKVVTIRGTQRPNVSKCVSCLEWFSLCFESPVGWIGADRKTIYLSPAGADPGFFLGGGALVSCSTLTPINHIVFFLQNTSCIRKPQAISGGGEGAHPLHPPPRSAPGTCSSESVPLQLSQKYKPSQHLYSNIINVSGHWNF